MNREEKKLLFEAISIILRNQIQIRKHIDSSFDYYTEKEQYDLVEKCNGIADDNIIIHEDISVEDDDDWYACSCCREHKVKYATCDTCEYGDEEL